ncbi:hypothetical protein L1049_012052 [Liquidambar formosana]|uniref:Uncharacterized protein n=1 Tax=Liquidambar formosana TaxID=63359 RepID=A0AAP0RSZ2_LIQFO
MYMPGSLYAICRAHRHIDGLRGWRMRSQAYSHFCVYIYFFYGNFAVIALSISQQNHGHVLKILFAARASIIILKDAGSFVSVTKVIFFFFFSAGTYFGFLGFS